MSNLHEEEALGKAYDSHLMRRLLKYMKPYRWRVGLALALVAVVTPLELAPPAIFQKAIDGNLRSEEHTSELQSRLHLVCRLLLEKKKNNRLYTPDHTATRNSDAL